MSSVAVTCLIQSNTVGGTISGLSSGGLVLANGSDTLAVNAGASNFTMPAAVTDGSGYAVTVQAQPIGFTCTVNNGTGTMGSTPVTNIVVSCVANTYTVGGSISGLTANGLVLLDNGLDALPVGANATQFTMNTDIAYGSTYAIAVQTAPVGLVCRVSNGTGVMGPANVTNITIGCVPNFDILYSFAGGSSDGSGAYHSLIQGSDGNFYGTTFQGGTNGLGTVFEVTPTGAESVLYSLSGSSNSYAGLVQDGAGNFYGTTYYGGSSGLGTVFKVTPGGTESVLYSFMGSSDGAHPYACLILGRDGNLYGTTFEGGTSDFGTVFELTPSGTETVLYAFTGGTDGGYPEAGLFQDSDGNFYGTTYQGGASGVGTVFNVAPSGTETVLYAFKGGSDGANPEDGVIRGSDGNIYGTTLKGGTSNIGTVFAITPGGTETVLHAFAGGSSDGASPYAGLVEDGDGNLYGTTSAGGISGYGTLFEISRSGTETVLHSFAPGSSDGEQPWAGLILGSDGNLYGATVAGGASNDGTVFELTLH
ncbi:MAG TPA: choice-of-anchor tandem repeat GloVer-containing protein [Steroidobacteraceae bacterium]|nr:choice-of-anchor tandem repeat GloVer-containing protein [Steroidobacteraceae bacterium]